MATVDPGQLEAGLLEQAGIAGGGMLPGLGVPTAAPLPGAAPVPAPQPLSGRTVRMVNRLGAVGDVPEEQVERAIAEGYAVETPQQAAVREYLKENRGISGAAKVALGQFADEALMGIPELILDKTSDPLEVAKREALKEEHQAANILGGVGGFGASLLLGGPLFKGAALAGRAAEGAATKLLAQRIVAAGAEKSVARAVATKTLASAAKLGTEAAVVASPIAITEAALGDPEEAAETMLYAMGGGAALGGLAPLSKELFARAAKGSVLAPGSAAAKLETFANDQAIKSLNPYGKIADRLAEVPGGVNEAGRVIREKGLFRRVGEGFDELTARIGAEKNATGEGIGAIYKQLDEAGVRFERGAVAQRMRDEVLAPLEKKVGFKSRAAKVAGYIDDFESKGAGWDMPAGELYETRRDLDRLIYGEKLPSPDQVDKELKGLRDIFKGELDAKVKSALGEETAAKLERLNRDYGILDIVEKGTKKNVGRDVRNRTNSLTDYLLGAGTSSAGGMAGSLIGGPVGGLVGGGVSQLVGMFGNKYLRQNFNSLAVQGAEKLGVLFGEQSMKRVALELDELPAAVGRLSKGGPASAEPIEALGKLLGVHVEEGAGAATKHEAFERITAKIAEAVANLPGTSERIGKVTGAIAEGGAPKVAEVLGEKKMAALQYLYETMPKAPPPRPFAAQTPWKPSPAALRAWEARIETLLDPVTGTLRHLGDGTLTPAHVDTLERVYPKLYARMKARIAILAAEKDAPVLTYRGRAALRTLTRDAEAPRRVPTPALAPKAPPPVPGPVAPPVLQPTDVQRITG